jgi:hypothetical protein
MKLKIRVRAGKCQENAYIKIQRFIIFSKNYKIKLIKKKKKLL